MFVHRYSINSHFTVNSSLFIHQCGHEDCLPGHRFGPVNRDHYLIHFILSGRGVLQSGPDRYALGPGQGFLITPGILTTYTADEADPWSYTWMGFNGEDAVRALSQRGLHIEAPTFVFDLDAGVRRCGEELIGYYGAQGNSFLAVSRMFELFSYINPAYDTRTPKDDVVNEMVIYLEDHFADVTVDRLAKEFNITRSQVFRLFKSVMGLAPQQYLLQYKVNRAASLLRTTSLSVEQIGEEAGFGNACNFSRQFKAAYGYSPLQYRNRSKRKTACYDGNASPAGTGEENETPGRTKPRGVAAATGKARL